MSTPKIKDHSTCGCASLLLIFEFDCENSIFHGGRSVIWPSIPIRLVNFQCYFGLQTAPIGCGWKSFRLETLFVNRNDGHPPDFTLDFALYFMLPCYLTGARCKWLEIMIVIAGRK